MGFYEHMSMLMRAIEVIEVMARRAQAWRVSTFQWYEKGSCPGKPPKDFYGWELVSSTTCKTSAPDVNFCKFGFSA